MTHEDYFQIGDLIRKLDRITIFRNVSNDSAVSSLIASLKSAYNEEDPDDAARLYCDFAARLYENGCDLTKHIRRLVYEDENPYIKQIAANGKADEPIEECAKRELELFQQLSQLSCEKTLWFIADQDDVICAYGGRSGEKREEPDEEELLKLAAMDVCDDPLHYSDKPDTRSAAEKEQDERYNSYFRLMTPLEKARHKQLNAEYRSDVDRYLAERWYMYDMPQYTISPSDLVREYAERTENLSVYGYGIYAQHSMFSLSGEGQITPVMNPDGIRLSQLTGYESQRKAVVDNALSLLGGKPQGNLLLYGDAGTGKSSTVKAVVNEFSGQGLRLLEIRKNQLRRLPQIIGTLSANPLRFIIFIDDLSFSGGAQPNGADGADDFAVLKSILEGGTSAVPENVLIYATSNRRHLIRESFSDRIGDDVHARDTLQEIASLSERFAVTVTFTKPDKRLYLSIVRSLAKEYELELPEDELFAAAERFALSKSGRSPRAARQFAEYMRSAESSDEKNKKGES